MAVIEKIRAIALDQNGEAIQGLPLGVGATLAPVTIANQAFLDWDVSALAVAQWDSSERLQYGVNEEMAEAGTGEYYESYAERYPLTEGVNQIRFFNNSGTELKLYRSGRAAK
jgi:hypothetical protein